MKKINKTKILSIILFMMFGISSVSASNYYSKCIAKAEPTAAGSVYVKYNSSGKGNSDTAESGKDRQMAAPTHKYYLTAEANTGYTFAGWSEEKDATSFTLTTQNSQEVSFTAATDVNSATKTYYAIFKPIYQFKAIANSEANGSVFVSFENAAGTYTSTSEATTSKNQFEQTTSAYYYAQPVSGYSFVGWFDEGGERVSLDNPYEATVSSNSVDATNPGTLTLTAHFASKLPTAWNPNFTSEQANSLLVEDVLPNVFTIANGDGGYTTNITPAGVIAYDAVANTITAVGEGTATLTFNQEETSTHFASSASFTFTVDRHTPVVTIKSPTLQHHSSLAISDFMEINNSLPVNIVSSEPTIIRVEGENLVANYDGDVTLTLTQSGDAYWKPVHKEVAIKVAYLYTQADYNNDEVTVEKVSAQGTAWMSDASVRLGGSETGAFDSEAWNWNDKFIVIKYDGIPTLLSFESKLNNGAATGVSWYVAESADGTNWTNATAWTNSETSFTSHNNIPLKSSTRYLKFCYSGNFAGYFRNITIQGTNKEWNNSTTNPAFYGVWTETEIKANIAPEATSIDVSEVYAISDVTFTPANPNCIIYASAGQVANTQNVVVDGTCANLVLTDGHDFAPMADFTADEATYTRNTTNTFASICLPFEAKTNSDVQLFEFGAVAEGAITLSQVETVAAGTPAMLKMLNEEATSITISGTDVNVVKEPVALSGDNHLVGTFSKITVGNQTESSNAASNAYALKDDQFHQGQDYFYVGAFRSYLSVSGTALPKSLFFVEEETEGITTDLEATVIPADKKIEGIYNLQGMRLGALTQGIHIIRYTDGTTEKVLVK